MAFGLFRKRPPEPAAPALQPQAVTPTMAADAQGVADSDSAREILELLELELGAMIRQLERAANSVAGGIVGAALIPRCASRAAETMAGKTTAHNG